MNCSEAEVLIHALLDGELDAGHARDVEAHLATCPACTAKFAALRTMRQAMAAAALKESAPAHLRARIEAALPQEFREVIVLREVQDLSYREITDVVGVPIGTVMSRLARARKRLAGTLGLDEREAS